MRDTCPGCGCDPCTCGD